MQHLRRYLPSTWDAPIASFKRLKRFYKIKRYFVSEHGGGGNISYWNVWFVALDEMNFLQWLAT